VQRFGDRGDERRVRVVQRETEPGCRLQGGVGGARVVERPARELFYEITAKVGEWRAFGARQDNHDRGAVREAVVQEVPSQSVVFGRRGELAHVSG
jgi:hypothetical protein